MGMTCQQVEPLIAAYADGDPIDGRRPAVEAHVVVCAACQEAVRIQQSVRTAVAACGREGEVVAPPGLRTRIAATIAAERGGPATLALGWRTRLSAFAAAAVVVLAVGAVLVPVVTGRSTVVLAAQLALDHLKCFVIDGHVHDHTISRADAEATLSRDYGWTLSVPETPGDDAGRLVAVRRCLYGEGRAAHLLYRLDDQAVSLFILPGTERPAEAHSVFGQDATVWSAGQKTWVLVGPSAARDRLVRMASSLRNSAE
jgi:anti-sigma factor RsiW